MATNKEVIKAFYEHRVLSNSSLWASKDFKLFSYNTCIAEILLNGEFIGNVTKYSVTTSKHQSLAKVKEMDYQVTDVAIGSQSLLFWLKKQNQKILVGIK